VTEFTANVNTIKSSRSTNFGFGNKIDISKSFNGISSKFYDVPSCFRKPSPLKKTSFGLTSRDSLDRVKKK